MRETRTLRDLLPTQQRLEVATRLGMSLEAVNSVLDAMGEQLSRRPPVAQLKQRLPTNAQAEVLDAIDLFESEHLRPPSLRELSGMLGIGVPGVKANLDRLKAKGFVDWDRNQAGTLRGCGLMIVGEVG